jgi:cytochrome P450
MSLSSAMWVLNALSRLENNIIWRRFWSKNPNMVGELGVFAYIRDLLMSKTSSVMKFCDKKYNVDVDPDKVKFFVGYLANRPALFLTEPEQVSSFYEQITSTDLDYIAAFPEIQSVFQRILGFSMVTVNIEEWAPMRARTVKFLTGAYLNHYEKVMHEVMKTEIFPDWKKHAVEHRDLDIYHSMLVYGCKAIAMSLMDISADQVPSDLPETLHELFDVLRESIYAFPLPKWVPTSLNRRFARTWAKMMALVEPYILTYKNSNSMLGSVIRTHTERLNIPYENLQNYLVNRGLTSDALEDHYITVNSTVRDYYVAHCTDDLCELVSKLVSLLGVERSKQTQAQTDIESFLCEGGTVNKQLVCEEFTGLLLGGSDLTIFFMTMACYSLAVNVDVQTKLRTYLKENPDVDIADKINKGYLGWVLNETLRQFPPVPATSRYIRKPITLKGRDGKEFTVDPKFVPWMYIIKLHNDPTAWQEPEKFLPERWAKQPVPGSFVPFGPKGPRVCPGMNYAKREAAVALITMVENFKISLADPNYRVKIDGDLTVRHLSPIMLRLESLDKTNKEESTL